MAKILVIDDQTFLVQTVSRVLTNAGHIVVTASEGRAGVDVFLRERPDLIITDIVMPGQGGLETINMIREHAPEAPIIAMSGETPGGRTDYLRIAKSIGATATLSKPITSQVLIEAVTNALAKPRVTGSDG
jgi:CheY-like chemotaxis protein